VNVWLVSWFVVSILVGGALLAIAIGLVRRLIALGRTLQRFQDEVQPVAERIAAEGARASERAAGMGERSPLPRR
jgi:hypothetical protein